MSNKKPTSQQRITDYNDEPNAFYLSMKDLSKKMSTQDYMSKCCDALLQVEPKKCVRQSVMEEYVEAQMEVVNRMGLNAAVVHMFEEYYLSPTIKPIPVNQIKRPSSFAKRMFWVGWNGISHPGILEMIYKDVELFKKIDSAENDGEYFESMYEVKGQAGRKSSFANRLNNILIHDGVDEVLVNVGGLKRFDMKTGASVPAETQRYVLDVYDGILTYTDDLKSVTVSFTRKTPAPSEGFKSGMYTTIAALQQLEHMQQVRKEFGVK